MIIEKPDKDLTYEDLKSLKENGYNKCGYCLLSPTDKSPFVGIARDMAGGDRPICSFCFYRNKDKREDFVKVR